MPTIAIENVRIFDGTKLTEPKTIVIENGLISEKTSGDTVFDGNGRALLPGLIDSHVHANSAENLALAAKSGITTMFDMANPVPEVTDSLRNRMGTTQILSCYYPALAGDDLGMPPNSIVASAPDAERYVSEVVDLGADYIKIILASPTKVRLNPPVWKPEILSAVVNSAHKHGKKTVAHVTASDTYRAAINAGVDILTHVPMVKPLPMPVIKEMANKGIVDIPTMVMMGGIISAVKKMSRFAPLNFKSVVKSVRKMRKSGITILTGTDANDIDGVPAQVPHNSLRKELEFLVEAGFSPTEALRSTTILSAKVFGLSDRGAIEIGRRADLVLVDGDPTVNIKSVAAVKMVWIGGLPIEI
jgi:imidazolonepropionase-like amidohydrolase